MQSRAPPRHQTAVLARVRIETEHADPGPGNIRLWVVYVDDFSGQDPGSWAQTTYRTSNLGAYDAILAVATVDRAYAFEVPTTVKNVSQSQVDNLRRNEVEPALRRGDWSAAAVAAANGLNTSGSTGAKVPLSTVLVTIGVVVFLLAGLLLVMQWRRRRRRAAELAAARRVDATDPDALASLSVDALDDLSKTKVVDVDNAVRTSDNELALAVEEFGTDRTQPFTRAVSNAKAALVQAFTVRQQLDDAIPETPAQRRDLLTRVIVSAAQADRELNAQTAAFRELRDLVLNAPTMLDTLTQQLVDLTARMAPSQQKLAGLHNEFESTALASVAGNVSAAQERLTFADQTTSGPGSWQRARSPASRPSSSTTFGRWSRRWDRPAPCSTRWTVQKAISNGPPGCCRRPSPTSRTGSRRPTRSCTRAMSVRPPNSRPPAPRRLKPSTPRRPADRPIL